MINNPPPFKGLKIRNLIIIPIEGGSLIRGLGNSNCHCRGKALGQKFKGSRQKSARLARIEVEGGCLMQAQCALCRVVGVCCAKGHSLTSL